MKVTSLDQHLDTLAQQPRSQVVQGLKELLPDLKPSTSLTGKRFISHDSYEGRTKLNKLADIYYCKAPTDEKTPMTTRLLHQDLFPHLKNLYSQTATFLGLVRELRLDENKTWADVVRGQEPEMSASFEFTDKEFKELWPNTSPKVSMTSFPERRTTHFASREMVEEAALREKSMNEQTRGTDPAVSMGGHDR